MPRIKDALEPASQCGLFQSVRQFGSRPGEVKLSTHLVDMGDSRPGLQAWKNPRHSITGSGVELYGSDSALIAAVEALERYSASIWRKAQIRTECADALGADALDLDSLPKCSLAERNHQTCRLVPPLKTVPIPWVRGVSLLTGKAVWVPAALVYLSRDLVGPAGPFCHSLSTGCAAHTSYILALLSAVLELVERDAISLVWLQKLTIPKIILDGIPQQLAPYWERCESSSISVEYAFFDATTDLGIPVVYGVQINPVSDRVRTLVTCSASPDPAVAIAKNIRDMAGLRLAFRNRHAVPDSWDNYSDPFDGATHMAHSDRAHAFNFLLHSPGEVRLSDIPAMPATDPHSLLRNVLQRFWDGGMEVYAVDLTTDEAIRSGLKVVRAIIPALQPLSFEYRARFLGHPRLYDAPQRMGYSVLSEERVNFWPQPFA